MQLERVFSKARWEPIVGYCRAVRAGQHIYVTGTTSVDESGERVHAPGDAYAQARRCLELIERALLVGDHLSEFVVGGLQRNDICGHVRGLLGTS